ncbi:MAG: hypothetical protein JNM85_04750 [Chthonomonas sp.]|nr:hypothetical protein [Chthonomonas sp.]
MRRGKPQLHWILLGVVLAGCASPALRPVTVDLSRVNIPARTVATTEVSLTTAALGPAETAAISALPAANLGESPLDSGVNWSARMEANRERTIKRLRSSLEKQYLREVTDDEEARASESRPSVDALISEGYDQIDRRFVATSDEMGRLRTKLANRIGHPDRGAMTPILWRPWMMGGSQHVVPIREEIDRMDARFDRDVAAILRDIDVGVDAWIVSNRVRTALLEDQALQRAWSEAKARANRDLFDPSANATVDVPKFAPGIGGAQITTMPLGSVKVPAPSRKSQRLPAAPSKALLEEVQIWAKLRGYRIVTSTGRGARDATDEFLNWRSEARP